MFEVNAKGYPRGIPTIRTQKAMHEHPEEPLLVLVDTGWAKDDITRLGVKKGYAVKTTCSKTGWELELKPIKWVCPT
jgi:tRNA 2-thiouridine synthesizing protein A